MRGCTGGAALWWLKLNMLLMPFNCLTNLFANKNVSLKV